MAPLLAHIALPESRFQLTHLHQAAIAQLGERQTEDLKVPGSIPGLGNLICLDFAMVADI